MSKTMSPQAAEAISEYANTGSETAFRRVVEAYLPLVMGTALRRTGGQRLLAEDVSQLVFIDLAKQAEAIRPATLAGWLHRHTCFTASKTMRSEQRRGQREKAAAAEATASFDAPDADRLDDLLQDLKSVDREALILRYVEGRSHADVGEALGISRAAAQKRSERALASLRSSLGSTLTGAGLLVMMAPPLADGATLAAKIGIASSAAAAASTATTGPLAMKPVAGTLWGAATAITLSAVPLSLAWREHKDAAERKAIAVERAHAATTAPARVFRIARAQEFRTPEEAVAALIALADRFGVGKAAADRSAALVSTLPPEWAHEMALQLERSTPHSIRHTAWESAVRKALAPMWQPRKVPDDLVSVWPVLSGANANALFDACARVNLAATRTFLEGFATEERLGHLRQPSVPHCALAEAVIRQVLKDCPEELATVFDRVPRMAWIGYDWRFPGTDAIREAARDPAIRRILTDSLTSMKDVRRRRAFQHALISSMTEPELTEWLEVLDPAQRAEAITLNVTPTEPSLAWWEREVPVSMQAELPDPARLRNFEEKSLRAAKQAWKPFASKASRNEVIHADHWAMLDALSVDDVAAWAKTMKKNYHDRRWHAVMMRWASLDGRAAVSHARAQEWNYVPLEAEMLACWMRSDFAGASVEIAQMRVSGDWAPAFATLAQIDIGRALEVTAGELKNAENENSGFGWPGDPGRQLAVQMRDPARKATFLRWLGDRTDVELAARMFSIVYSGMDHEVGWLRPERLPDFAPARNLLPQTLEHPDSVWAMGAIAEGQNPVSSLRDRATAPHPKHTDAPRFYNLARRLNHWAARDPGSAGLWLLAQEPSRDHDDAIVGYAGAVRLEDPAAAVQWAGRLSDPGERVRRTSDFFGRWYQQDPTAAEAWLADAGFSEIHRHYIAGRAVIGR